MDQEEVIIDLEPVEKAIEALPLDQRHAVSRRIFEMHALEFGDLRKAA